MATISYDGQSFIIDGRRIWLVSGAIHYFRTPRELWRARIRAAKEAGLNCIETYCAWNAHEPKPGHFDFTGDLDLRAFVKLVGEEGLYCIVRPGPYICGEWDFGGHPAWLHRQFEAAGESEVKLRQSHPIYLEACARFLGAVMDEIKYLQITATATPERASSNGNAAGQPAGGYLGGGGGPVIMIQAENEWFSHNPDEHDKYLREMVRYLRENGCTVPINNCNNLWQRIDGTIDTWNGARNLAFDMRQLAVVQPHAPRLVTEYWPGWFDMWGAEHSTVDTDLHLYRVAAILATGSQYNLYMFHGGTNFAFYGGRTIVAYGGYMTTSYDYDAPLLEAGGRGPKYRVTKRISTFASQFGYVFSHLATDPPHAAIAPRDEDHPLSVVHLCGSQGEVIFLLRSAQDKTTQTQLMLPNGLTLPVHLGKERAAWLLINTNLGGVAKLNYTNLRPLAFIERKLLVLFGPAGCAGMIGLDDAQYRMTVPDDGAPHVERHDELAIVVLSTEQADDAYLFAGGIALGAGGLDTEGQPIPRDGKPLTIIDTDGKVVVRPKPKAGRTVAPPKLNNWTAAAVDELVDGTATSYTAIDRPRSLESLGADFGYGWYRLRFDKASSGATFAPESGDRLHVFGGGKPLSLLGLGPGATDGPVNLRLSDTVTILADNLGRFNYGQPMGEKKGLFGHLFNVKPVKLGKPKRTRERAADPFAVTRMVYRRRKGDLPMVESLSWTLKPAAKLPMVLFVQGLDVQGVWLINGRPVNVFLGSESAKYLRLVLTPGQNGFTAGNNELKFSPLQAVAADVDIASSLTLYQATAVPSAKAEWSFAPWTVPDASAFTKLSKTPRAGVPCWYRTSFTVDAADVPLWLEPRGLSKGQLYLNGHNIGRFFVATNKGKRVPPQERYYLPEPWLNLKGENELLIFDEHGFSPTKSRLVYDPMGPYNG